MYLLEASVDLDFQKSVEIIFACVCDHIFLKRGSNSLHCGLRYRKSVLGGPARVCGPQEAGNLPVNSDRDGNIAFLTT